MGGSVGLKGTDGAAILVQARKLGAQPGAGARAAEFLVNLIPVRERLLFFTASEGMGAAVLHQLDFSFEVVYTPSLQETSARDTIVAVQKMKEHEVSIVVFVGGDGTARDIFTTLGAQGVVLGIPAGVKIHSGVFALNPAAAATALLRFLWDEVGLTEAEVMDIDEDAFRKGSVQSQLFGYMLAPAQPAVMQGSKMASPSTVDERENQLELGRQVVDEMRPGTLYLVGPGTTCRAVAEVLGLEKTLLGVDALVDKSWVARDINESQILALLDKYPEAEIIVTAIGAQGFVFGRGNLQFSPAVLRKVPPKHWRILVTRQKFESLPEGHLRIDTRDPVLDQQVRGLYRVLIAEGEYRIVEIR